MATRYYVQFLPYGSTAPVSLDGGSLYAVSDVSYGATQTLNIGSQSSGAGAGKVSFGPLSFTLGSSALTAMLDQREASGTPFQQVRLYAVNTGLGSAPVLADTFKLAAVKSDAVNVATGAHAVTMEYGGLVESRTAQTADGSPGKTTTGGWNVVKNVQDVSQTSDVAGQAAAPAVPATLTDIATRAASPDQDLHLYLHLQSSNNTTLGGGWIALDAASLSSVQTLNIGSQATGAGADKITFNPLSLQFKPGTLEPLLLQQLSSGTPFKQVEIAAFKGDPTGQLVDDYRFGTAALQTADRTVAAGTATVDYTLEYGQEQVTHYGQTQTGATTSTTEGWDAVRNVAYTSPSSLPQQAPTTQAAIRKQIAPIGTAEGAQAQYYVQFILYGSTTPVSLDGGSLYAVSDVSYGATQTLNIGSQSSGAGAGKVSFGPLSFTLGSSALTAMLDQREASGTPFQQVRLYAVNTGLGSAPVLADTFKLAAVKSDAVNAATGAHAVTMEYGGLVESRTAQTADGSPGKTTTGGWNVVKNVQDMSQTSDVAGQAAAPAVPATLSDIATRAASPDQDLHLYLHLQSSNNTTLGGGWIALDAASLSSVQTLNIGSQATGAGAGKITFDPLSLQFKPGTLEPLLLQQLSSGTPFKQVEIAAFKGDSTGQLVDDYRFGTAALQTADRTVAAGTASVDYTLEYGQEQVTHYGQTQTGATTSTTEGWDVVHNVAYTTPSSLPQQAPTTEAAIRRQIAPIGTAEGAQAQYYVQFISYGSTTPVSLDGGSLYAVSDVSYGATQTLNIGSQSSGAGAGKVSFGPLSFTLGSSALTAMLDQREASGTPFQQVRLYAVNTGLGSAPVLADTFKLAAVKSDAVNAATGAHAVTMEYGGLVESRTAQTADGSPGKTTTGGWNVVKNVQDMSQTSDVAGQAAAPAVPATLTDIATRAASPDQDLHLYLHLQSSNNTTLGGGWIALDAASLSSVQTLNIGSQATGAGAGKITFDPLSLQFKPGTLEPLLLQQLSSGTPFKQVEIAAFKGDPTGQLVDDYRFGTAALQTADRTVAAGTATVDYTLEYGQEQVTHYGQTQTGATTSTTEGWDAVRNVAYTSPSSLPQQAPTTEAAIRRQIAPIGTAEGADVAPDPGPTAAAGALTVGHGKALDVTAYLRGLVTAGRSGDAETITAVTGNATLNGGVVTYTAPASGSDTFGYTVQDQLGHTANGSVAVTVDPGPSVGPVAALKVGHGQSVAIGTAHPGLPGDSLSLALVTPPAAGALTLANGIVTYEAEANVPSGGTTDTFSYAIADGYGDLSAPQAGTLLLDTGPTASSGTITVDAGSVFDATAAVKALIVPGLTGDTETITSVTARAVLSGGSVLYTAPAAGLDTFDYTVQDQLNETAHGTVTVRVVNPPGASASVGSGPDQLVLKLSEDAYLGDAHYTVAVDGQQIGGVQTASAAHGAGSDTLQVNGTWSPGDHVVTLNFLNDLYGGSQSTDRNLYVDGATYNGVAQPGVEAALYGNGPVSLLFDHTPTSATSIGTGPDQLALKISEDAYQGNAQYTVSVDGQQIGGPQAVLSAHGAGSDTVLVNGTWAPGPHTFTIDFTNDRYGGSASADRNLYVDGATYQGTAVNGAQAELSQSGPLTLAFGITRPAPPATASIGTGPDQLALHLSEDAYQGDAQYTVMVDGHQIGGPQTALSPHGTGSDTLLVNGNWAAGDHTVNIAFLNDLYGGSASTDRNLYLDGATYNGESVAGAHAAFDQNGSQKFGFHTPAPLI